ncbi:MAG TPA: YdcF family protein [Candidatus Limnocylindria bacterium]|nr:YdcF family protein [Candidatus Limnocylindria bacterium]
MSVADAPELAVVLGGGLAPDGGPLPSTAARAHRAAQLARERPALVVICSGDRQLDAADGTPSEAALMRDLIAGRGIAPDRIAVEDESRDTIGNAVLTAVRYLRGLEPRPLAVISSPFHIERATETFRHVLGYAWQIEAIASDETDDDVERAARETRYLQETTAFFAGVRPGDVREAAQRLRARWPYYAGVARLDGDASPHR